MHSSSIFTILSASALFALTSAIPLPPNTCEAGSGKSFYTCASNGFSGCCSVDPCNLNWCPDTTVTPAPAEPVKAASGSYYACATSGFHATCSYDPCDGKADSWCNDYEYKTYDLKKAPSQPSNPPSTPAPQPQWYVCSSNGFRGTCSVDACNVAWCPDYEYKTYEPKKTVAKRDGEFHCQTLSGHFDGICKSDPCFYGSVWCPDYVPGTYVPKTTAEVVVEPAPKETTPKEPTTPLATSEQRFVPGAGNTCQAGLQFYQCAQFGGVQFNGCCSYDPCYSGSEWCADYKTGSYTLAI